MRSDANSLDLNNLPQDYYTRDGHEASPNTSSSAGGYRKKKSGGGGAKDDKDEVGKIYECRFCSLKFCKSQALGGHMNRHRQERETETLNKARQLVFSNDLAPPHLGYVSSGHGVYNQPSNINSDESSSSLPFRSIYTSRMYPTSPLIPPPPPPLRPAPPANDYYVGHVVPNSHYGGGPNGSYYTCIGAPVGHGLVNSGGSGRGGGGDAPEEGLNWGRR